MGTRTEILNVASSLKALAAKNPSVARELQPIVSELEAVAERADKKRLERKKAISGLLATPQRAAPPLTAAPKPNFLSTAVVPRLNDPALIMQVKDYEKSLQSMTLALQTMSSIQREQDAAMTAIRNNLR